jgi:TP901 family phage tail tape measure protein
MSKVRGGQVFVEIGADPKKFFAALTKLNGQIGKLGASMQNVGAKMTAIGVGLGVPIGLAIRQFAAFDDAIRATAAVSQASGRELQMLNDKARDLGATTSFTAIEVANLMTELGRAGFKPDEINAMTAAVLDLARATGSDATLASGIMAATLRQFGLGAAEATRAADVLTKTANSTFNTVESLGEALKYAGPVAKSLGLSLEDTSAILGILGNVGIKGSEAGTALRRLSVISSASGKKLQELFGVTNTDAAGNLKPLVQILDEINTATATMPVAERTKRMAEAFGLLGITSANVLSTTAGGVTDLAAQLRKAEGTAAKAAKEMDAGLGGAFRIALSAIEGTALALGDALAPSLITALNGVINISTAITGFAKRNEALIVSMAKGLGIFVGVGGALIGVGASLKLVAFAMSGLLSPLAFAITGIASLAAGFLSAVVSTAAAIVSVTAYGVASVAAATASGAAWAIANIPLLLLVGAVGGLTLKMLDTYDAVGMVKSGVASLPGAVSNAARVFADLGKIGSDTFGGIADAIADADMEGAIKIMMAGVKAAFMRGKEAIMSVVDGLMTGLDAAINDVMGRWEDYTTVFGRIGAFFGNQSDIEALDAIDKGLVAYGSKGRLNSQLDSEAARASAADGRRADTIAAQNELRDTIAGVRAPKMRPKAGGPVASGPLDIGAFDAKQAEEFIKQAASAATLEALSQLTYDFNQLAESGNISTQQIARFQSASDAAMAKIDPSTAAALNGAATAGADAAASQADVAGTFSSTNLGGMGFGQSLFQKLADYGKRTADATEQLADNFHAGLVAE